MDVVNCCTEVSIMGESPPGGGPQAERSEVRVGGQLRYPWVRRFGDTRASCGSIPRFQSSISQSFVLADWGACSGWLASFHTLCLAVRVGSPSVILFYFGLLERCITPAGLLNCCRGGCHMSHVSTQGAHRYRSPV